MCVHARYIIRLVRFELNASRNVAHFLNWIDRLFMLIFFLLFPIFFADRHDEMNARLIKWNTNKAQGKRSKLIEYVLVKNWNPN